MRIIQMSDNDTSDEAFWKWDEDNKRWQWYKSFSEHALDGWQECRRRCEARMEERESSAFCYAAGWVKGLMTVGNVPTTDQILDAYRAFKEGQK